MGEPLSLRLNFSGLGAKMEYVPVPVLFHVHLVAALKSYKSCLEGLTGQDDVRHCPGSHGPSRDIDAPRGLLRLALSRPALIWAALRTS